MDLAKLAYLSSSFYQIGYVVPDIDKASQYFRDAFGVERFFVMRDAPIQAQTYLGRPAEIHQNVGFAYAGNFNIEIIQPLSGDSTYSKYLSEHPKGGLHHVGLKVPDYQRAIDDMLTAGYQVLQTGRFGNGTRFAYVDTDRVIGHYTEIFYWDAETEYLFAQIRLGRF